MKFNYTATNKEGKTIQGAIEAPDHQTALANISKQGLHPIIVQIEKSKGTGKAKGKKVKTKELVIFTRQLSTMVSAGVPITRSLATLENQTQTKNFKSVIAAVAKEVEGGISLGVAMSKYPNVFSDVYVNMVRAGEAGGILDEILKRLATQVEGEATIRKKIKGAMMYPLVISVIAVVAFFFIMILIIPKISKILNDLGGPNARLPIYTRVLLTISSFVQHNALFIVVGVGLFIFLFRRFAKSTKGRYQIHAMMLRLPILKGIVIKIAIARFARTFASLMSAGVGVLDALEVTGGAIGNKVIEAELKEAAKEVKNGKALSEPISQSKHFPPIVAQMLAIGEETGQIDTILIKVADFYEEEVDTVIDSLASIIEPIMIVGLGSVVGVIAASVMGPIASLSKNIGSQ